MILEKVAFLEQAIETSYEEVLEELCAMEEGADFQKSKSVIEKIMRDLRESAINFSSSFIEKETESQSTRLDIPDATYGGSGYLFEVGDRIQTTGKVHTRRFIEFVNRYGHPDTIYEAEDYLVPIGSTGTILVRGKHIDLGDDTLYYIILFDDGKKYIFRTDIEPNIKNI